MPSELVLIIEDNEKNRKLVRDVLQVKGYKTIESETAEEGINLAIEKSPSLILMEDTIRAFEKANERDRKSVV